ncbi:hypothetical protein [Filimonas lacunae]|nr:hypothetical protein [Filimonas lacunae]
MEINFPANAVTPTENIPALTRLANTLEELQYALQECFLPYIDVTQRIPLIIMDRFKKSVLKQLPEIKRLFTTKKVNTKLAKAILQPFEAILEPITGQKMATGKLVTLYELMDSLTEMLNPANQAPDMTMQLISYACYCNLNSSTVITAIQEVMTQYMKSMEQHKTILYTITYYTRHFEELNCKPHFIYDHTNRHAKSIILEWLKEYHTIYQKEMEEWEAISAILPGSKILTSLKVDELGFYLKLLTDRKYIMNTNKKQIAKLTCESVQTISKYPVNQPISEYNLYNAMYTSNYTSIQAVRNMLAELQADATTALKELNKNNVE